MIGMKYLFGALLSLVLLAALIFGLIMTLYDSENVDVIHVVVSPTDSSYSEFIVYYEDYFDPPISYYKKGFDIVDNKADAISIVIGKANFVSSEVVIVAPEDFQLDFKYRESEFNKEVTYIWY